MKTISVLTLLFLASACSLPAGGLDGGTIAGLECARVQAGDLDPLPEGCYRSVVSPGCLVLPPGEQCGDALPWYPGGVAYDVWCDLGRELERDPVALVRVECAEVGQ